MAKQIHGANSKYQECYFDQAELDQLFDVESLRVKLDYRVTTFMVDPDNQK